MGVRLVLSPRGVDAEVEARPTKYEFDQDRILLGRGAGTDVRLPDPSVSVRHATIRLDGARYVIVDHGSTNGTRVNDQLIVPERPKPLRDGDTITLGIYSLRYASGIAVHEPSSLERTATLARRLAREASSPGTSLVPRVVVLNGDAKGKVLDLPEPPARVVIGRGETAELSIPDADASRDHCELVVTLDGVSVRDLGSKNGVLVNERAVTEARLHDRDELTIGATAIAFEDPAEAALKALESAPDVPLPPPAPAPPPAVPTVLAPEPVREPEQAIVPAPRAPAGLSGVELFVGLLALLVLAASLAGLYFLLGGG
jgi:pSer/pThr/pTyr-binding forkhead associated (FHA) protein